MLERPEDGGAAEAPEDAPDLRDDEDEQHEEEREGALAEDGVQRAAHAEPLPLRAVHRLVGPGLHLPQLLRRQVLVPNGRDTRQKGHDCVVQDTAVRRGWSLRCVQAGKGEGAW